MTEHPIEQEIESIVIHYGVETVVGVASCPVIIGHTVGEDGVTWIEACTKPGMHSYIPYVRVWRGDVCVAEFCQHSIVGVYFKAPS